MFRLQTGHRPVNLHVCWSDDPGSRGATAARGLAATYQRADGPVAVCMRASGCQRGGVALFPAASVQTARAKERVELWHALLVPLAAAPALLAYPRSPSGRSGATTGPTIQRPTLTATRGKSPTTPSPTAFTAATASCSVGS